MIMVVVVRLLFVLILLVATTTTATTSSSSSSTPTRLSSTTNTTSTVPTLVPTGGEIGGQGRVVGSSDGNGVWYVGGIRRGGATFGRSTTSSSSSTTGITKTTTSSSSRRRTIPQQSSKPTTTKKILPPKFGTTIFQGGGDRFKKQTTLSTTTTTTPTVSKSSSSSKLYNAIQTILWFPITVIHMVYYNWWYRRTPEMIRFFISGALANMIFLWLDTTLYEYLTSHTTTLGLVVDDPTTVSYTTAYVLQTISTHFLNSFLVYGLTSINTVSKYFTTLRKQFYAYFVGMVLSVTMFTYLTSESRITQLQWMDRRTALWTTTFIVAGINYVVISRIMKKPQNQDTSATTTTAAPTTSVDERKKKIFTSLSFKKKKGFP